MDRDLVIGIDVPQLCAIVQAVDRDRRAVPDKPDRAGAGRPPGVTVVSQAIGSPVRWRSILLVSSNAMPRILPRGRCSNTVSANVAPSRAGMRVSWVADVSAGAPAGTARILE